MVMGVSGLWKDMGSYSEADGEGVRRGVTRSDARPPADQLLVDERLQRLRVEVERMMRGKQ